ncbi:MAG: hypothetical protein J6I49_07365, partial [Bacteroidales bacterium]|nr:hypothetical protein [Bacteroidales bacterium]
RLSETHRLAWLSVPTLRFACVGLLKIQPLRGFIGTIFDYPHATEPAMSRLSETHRLVWFPVPTLRFACVGLLKI